MTPTRRPRRPGRRAGRGRSCAVILYKCARVLMLKETAISVNESLPFAKPTLYQQYQHAAPLSPGRISLQARGSHLFYRATNLTNDFTPKQNVTPFFNLFNPQRTRYLILVE